ncbi:hypothetical protein HDC92_000005 [Pedobacter sp. AK017]|nr:hypothetical protein [Pedobacter sp. AK017]
MIAVHVHCNAEINIQIIYLNQNYCKKRYALYGIPAVLLVNEVLYIELRRS